MKRNKKSINVLFLGIFIALVVIAIAGMNMRTLINSNGVTRIAKKAGANDAIAQDVLENYTFTSDTAGINQEGTIKDYSEYEGRFKLLASAAPESKIYNLTLSPGYYTHINVDATDVYNEGHDDGFDEGYEDGIKASYIRFGQQILNTTFSGDSWTGTINTTIGYNYAIIVTSCGFRNGHDHPTFTIGSGTTSFSVQHGTYMLPNEAKTYGVTIDRSIVSSTAFGMFVSNSTNYTISVDLYNNQVNQYRSKIKYNGS